MAGNPRATTEKRTDPIRAKTTENATKDRTDKTASPTLRLPIPIKVKTMAHKICTGKKKTINMMAPGKSVRKNIEANTSNGNATIKELVIVVDLFLLPQG
jgi:hypothetical protein